MKKLGLLALLTLIFIAPAYSHAATGDVMFPAGFLWGTATSSYQVEGGIYNNDWYEFEQTPGHIKNNDKCGLAADQYNRFREDLDLAKSLNTKIYRLSIEWARIEPEEGKFDQAAIAHYRDLLTEIKKRDMIPFVTLFHFCLPTWLSKQGGWCDQKTAERFAIYSGRMAHEYGDLVDFWTTHNEPMGYLVAGYLGGKWAPGFKNPIKFWQALGNLIKGHGLAYYTIKQNDAIDADGDGKPAPVGLVTSYALIDPYNPKSKINCYIAEKANNIMNHMLLDAITFGKSKAREHISTLKDARSIFLPEAPNTLDFSGVNYYTHFLVKMSVTDPIIGIETMIRTTISEPQFVEGEQTEHNDMGWMIYPEGIYRAVMSMKKYNVPVYITENGIPDKTGKKRAKYIANHLLWLKKAIDDGVDLKGYIHWALIDNFEWADGFGPRFGLYSIDYATQKRSLTEGGAFYAEVCRNNGLKKEMIDSVNGIRQGDETDKLEKFNGIK